MAITEHHIQTTRTARYYSLGSFDDDITELWFVLHGYSQRAEDFIANFIPIIREGMLIVAPEALSRFYSRGFAGEVAASWMTREDRMHEIADYILYLDTLFAEIRFSVKKNSTKNYCSWFFSRMPNRFTLAVKRKFTG